MKLNLFYHFYVCPIAGRTNKMFRGTDEVGLYYNWSKTSQFNQKAIVKNLIIFLRNNYFRRQRIPGLHARLQKVFLKFSKQVGHLPKRFSGILNWRWLSSSWDLEQHSLTPSLVFPSSFGSSFLFWYLAIRSFANVGHSAWSILIVSWSARTIHILRY